MKAACEILNSILLQYGRKVTVILLAILVCAAVIFSPPAPAAAADTASLIVKLASGLSPQEQTAVIVDNGGVETSAVPALRLHVVEVPAADLQGVMEKYQGDPRVVHVEENRLRKAEAMASLDPFFSSQWALPRIGWDSVFNTPPAGSSIVALLDTGIDASHPDLAGRVLPGISLRDGGDGRVDANGHGTWLAGIIAASTDNGEGVAGVGYAGVSVMPVSVLGMDGTGSDGDIIAGVVWAVDNGANVILMGFSNSGFSQNLQDAIDYAWSKNVVVVAATGNDAMGVPTYPAGMRGVVGVSATDPDDSLAPYSNYGLDTFLAAPGSSIMTTGLANPDPNLNYQAISGTSASSAIVAGVAGFMKAMDPALSNGAIVGRLGRSADAIGIAGDPNNTLMFGNGRVNMAKALADSGSDPVQPVGVPGGGGPYIGPYVAAGNSGFSGTVKDNLGNGISGASVSCTSGCTGSTSTNTTSTNSSGIYPSSGKFKPTFSGSGSATITLTASASGFTTQSVTLVVMDLKVYTQNFTLSPACTAPSVTTDPSNQTVTYGGNAAFSAAASGSTPLNVLWEVNSGSGWSGTGITTTDLTLATPTVAMSGSQYRAVFTNGCGSATSAAATLTVNPADASCSISGYSGVYDAAEHGATGSCSGIGGESAGTLDLGAKFKNVPGGSANWSFTANGNYKDQSGSVAINISKASLTVTADNKSMIFGEPLPTFTFQYSGFVGGENGSVIDTPPTCSVGAIPMYGTYPIVCSGGADNNYSLSYVNGTLTVQAWTLKGFYQPVDMNGIWNTVKNGSTVPLKFEVFAGGTELTDVSKIKSVNSLQVQCNNNTMENAIEEVVTTTGGTMLRYDTTGGQFIDNWKTPNRSGNCYRVIMTTLDGSSLTALFKLK